MQNISISIKTSIYLFFSTRNRIDLCISIIWKNLSTISKGKILILINSRSPNQRIGIQSSLSSCGIIGSERNQSIRSIFIYSFYRPSDHRFIICPNIGKQCSTFCLFTQLIPIIHRSINWICMFKLPRKNRIKSEFNLYWTILSKGSMTLRWSIIISRIYSCNTS